MALFKTDAKPLFFVGIPTWGTPSFAFVQTLLSMHWPSNFSMHQVFLPGYEIGRARNIIVHKALQSGARFLLFLDEDVIGPVNGVQALLYHLQNHPEWTCVGGLYCTKSTPPEPLIYPEIGHGALWDFKIGDLIQVVGPKVNGFMGSGFHLLRLADLERMKTPRTYEERDPWSNEHILIREYYKTTDEQRLDGEVNVHEGGTEDAFFYNQCYQDGLECWIDTGIQCLHVEVKAGTVYSIPETAGACVKPDAWNCTPRVANLGSGQSDNPYEVNVDLRSDNPNVYKRDIRKLPDDWSEQFDIVKAYHVLEHFPYGASEEIVREWVRILKPGGTLDLRVPDLESAADHILQAVKENKRVSMGIKGVIHGDQGNPYHRQNPYGEVTPEGRYLPHSFENNTHKASFTKVDLTAVLMAAGLTEIQGERSLFELRMKATKPKKDEPMAEPQPQPEPTPEPLDPEQGDG